MAGSNRSIGMICSISNGTEMKWNKFQNKYSFDRFSSIDLSNLTNFFMWFKWPSDWFSFILMWYVTKIFRFSVQKICYPKYFFSEEFPLIFRNFDLGPEVQGCSFPSPSQNFPTEHGWHWSLDFRPGRLPNEPASQKLLPESDPAGQKDPSGQIVSGSPPPTQKYPESQRPHSSWRISIVLFPAGQSCCETAPSGQTFPIEQICSGKSTSIRVTTYQMRFQQ